MEALNNKEKVGVALLVGGMATALVGGVAILFSEQLELTEQRKEKMKNTTKVGAVVAVAGYVVLHITLSER